MISKKLSLLVIFLFFCVTGCTTISNVLITPHPDSLREGGAKILLTKDIENSCIPRNSMEEDIENALRSSQSGGGVVISIAVAGVVKLLEEEAKQYKASYSATDSGDLNNFNCISFKRESKDDEVLTYFNIYLDEKDTPAFRLKIDKIQLTGFQSKIASWPPITLINGRNPWDGDSLSSKIGNTIGWVNPLMILHAIYSLFDWDDVYSVETQMKIRLDSVVTVGGQRSLVNVGAVDLPSEKHSIFSLKPINLSEDVPLSKEKPFKTGYLALPTGAKLPTNIFITIVEGNGFGNIVGQGAKQVAKQKSGIVDKVTGWLGL